MAPTEAQGALMTDLPLEWTSELSVGVPEIDADHQVLIDLIAQVRAAGEGFEARAVVGTVLNALVDYTEYHFIREERMQEAVGYPRAREHKAHHERLRYQVLEYQQLWSDDPTAVSAAELAEFLRRWLMLHIMHEDMLYKPYVENNQTAREAAASIGLDFFLGAMEDDEEFNS